ncbi:hypothetical protein Mapa_002341 [Marchantia paleacea]|nr:hypothetical protein Mapa_002341 [Marchantia paleacea]
MNLVALIFCLSDLETNPFVSSTLRSATHHRSPFFFSNRRQEVGARSQKHVYARLQLKA